MPFTGITGSNLFVEHHWHILIGAYPYFLEPDCYKYSLENNLETPWVEFDSIGRNISGFFLSPPHVRQTLKAESHLNE